MQLRPDQRSLSLSLHVFPEPSPVVPLCGGFSVWASWCFLLACWLQGSWTAFQRVSVPAPKEHPGSEVIYQVLFPPLNGCRGNPPSISRKKAIDLTLQREE